MSSVRFESGNQVFFSNIADKTIIHSPKTTMVLILYTQACDTRGKISANVVN